MIGPIADAERLYEQSFQDIISLTFPLYYIRIPAVNQVRSNVLLEFYEKYKYLGNASMLEDYMEYWLSLMNYDVDLVPALKLEFWPDDMQVFLNRIQNSRPKLYEIILEQASMHLIPKWSSKTQEVDQELEFRYSFSAIERLLAKNRTRIEQILNGVARSIYYRYLKKEPCLEDHTKTIVPSYFIKTTVLWMCELYNLNDLCSETDDDQTIANIMATEWLNYVREKLCSGYCPHYFIDSFNLLETCSLASLTRAASILEHEVRLYEDIKIDVLIEQDKLMGKQQQTTENWLQNMKVKDILAAVNDYRLMRENWLCPPEKNQDEGDVSDCFYTLSQLRALDGDKQQNWNTYQRLFLTVDQSTWLPPIWDEQVAECSVCDFVDGLIASGSCMKQILEAMKKSDIEQTMARSSREMELFSAQNFLNDLIQPGNIVQNGLMTSWLPMFTCSYFNQSLTNVPSIRQRSIIANHPTGPLQDLLQGRTCPTPLDPQSRQTYQQYAQNASYRFLDLLSDAPNIDMTLGDLLKYYDRPSRTNEPVITSSIEEQILSHATNSSSVNKESQQQTGLFHRTTKWQQINFWLKNLASMIEKPAENYAYWDQKHHSIVDGNQSISSTIHPSMTTTFDEIKWNDTIEVTFSLDNNNQTRLSDSILVEVDDQENIISQQFTIFATMANVYQQNKINTEQQSLLYFNDVIPSLDTQLISFPLKSTIEFTLIDAKLPITATIVNVEDQRSIKFQCSYFIIIKHLCQIARQLFVVNSDYYRLLFQNNVLDGDDMSLDAIDCSMI
ncbi:unnamed protein product [Rotaria sordida]|uniref:Uncharacterized protein n=2 Tax=Rotaria sordida TaxID=392033 RepID=A0A815JSV4_9BILA|nr:unnamed protein product [Rotaria sordida]